MIPGFTYRAEKYVQQIPQCGNLSKWVVAKKRLIKGIARLLAWAYREGFAQGRAHGAKCDCVECKRPSEKARKICEKQDILNIEEKPDPNVQPLEPDIVTEGCAEPKLKRV
ncbi:MAG: hypothetical protein MUP16_04880 [Sedimentisphaerales bacterium]|nr:hypothetical protein [Sedimentisphaerales bacterium]